MGSGYDYVAKLAGQDAYIYQALNWSTGDSISFDWNFTNQDSSDDDFGVFGILDLTSYSATDSISDLINNSIIDVIEILSPSNGSSTGWEPYSYTFTFDSTSDYAIIFGVDSDIPHLLTNTAPILLVDNITTTTVPEPATLFLLASGFLSIAKISRKL